VTTGEGSPTMSAHRVAVAAVFVLLTLTSCASGSADNREGGASGSCAQRVRFKGVIYQDAGAMQPDLVGSGMGTAQVVVCGDHEGGSTSEPVQETVTAHEVVGIDSSIAVAVVQPDGTHEIFVVPGRASDDRVKTALE
jgi:hypothetical protein